MQGIIQEYYNGNQTLREPVIDKKKNINNSIELFHT